METMKNRGKSSEVVRWEKYLPKTVLRVLLVESDDSTRQIITALLQKCCYKVVAVSDGLAAWETLKERPQSIDIILTELDLPSISGFALLALVMEHEACKNIPVIMMSSQESITMVLKCILKGASDYLIKPMRKNELKHLWQHVWRRLTLRDDPSAAYVHSLRASQQNLEDTDETSADSRDHSDQGSGAEAISYNGQKKLMEDAKSVDERNGVRMEQKFQSFDVTMDLIGGIEKGSECLYGNNNTHEENIGPKLELSLKRCYSGSFEKQNESKHQKLSLSDASAEPKTPTESHEKLREKRSDQVSTTTSSNQENIGSSRISRQCEQNQLSNRNKFVQSEVKDSTFTVESNRMKGSKEEDSVNVQHLERERSCIDKVSIEKERSML